MQKNSMQKKLSKKKTTKLLTTTSRIYSKVCSEVGTSLEKLSRQLMFREDANGVSVEEAHEMREKIDSLYCKYLCELDTEVLEDIVSAHVTKQVNRAPRTLDIIQKELLERSLNETEKGNDH